MFVVDGSRRGFFVRAGVRLPLTRSRVAWKTTGMGLLFVSLMYTSRLRKSITAWWWTCKSLAEELGEAVDDAVVSNKDIVIGVELALLLKRLELCLEIYLFC